MAALHACGQHHAGMERIKRGRDRRRAQRRQQRMDNGKPLPGDLKAFTPDEIETLRAQPITSAAVLALRSQ